MSREPVGEGARHLDAGARTEGGLRARRARVRDLLRRGRHPRGGAGLLPPPERADPRLRGRGRRRHPHDGLQRLHAEPSPGEPPAAQRCGPPRARERQPRAGGRTPLRDGRRLRPLPLARRGRELRAAAGGRAQGPARAEDRAVLRLPDPPPVEAHGLRRPGQARLPRADHQGVRRRPDRLPGQDQVLRLPDHPGTRGHGPRRAHPADRAGEGGRRGRDRHAVPALPPLARRVAVEAQEADRARTSRCRSCTCRS